MLPTLPTTPKKGQVREGTWRGCPEPPGQQIEVSPRLPECTVPPPSPLPPMHRPWCHSIGALASAVDCCAVGVDTEGLSGLGGGQGAWWCADIVTPFGCITGQQLHVYKGHDYWVNGVAVAPNSQFLVTTSTAQTIGQLVLKLLANLWYLVETISLQGRLAGSNTIYCIVM